jgi:hypothetical protein
MVTVKLIPHLLSWFGLVLLLMRGFPGRRVVVAAAGGTGFVIGSAGSVLLLRAFPGDTGFGIIRTALGGSFILFWWISVFSIYSSTGRNLSLSWRERMDSSPLFAAACSLAAGALMGAVCDCRLPGSGTSVPGAMLLCLAAALLVISALPADKLLPATFAVTPSGLMAAVVALLLFCSSTMPRLDLFSPLSMKVMKFAHDFVHQFFESMLIPDHFFFNSFTWDFIGFFFGKGVGFWGALIIWFIPVILVLLAIRFERLPTVAHIRQGAQRRKLLAAAIGERRYRLVIPVLSAAVFAAATYQSRFPSVEYWDPKPLPVSASQAGEIFIPKKGEVNLEDGKLHKYLFKQGGREARFFVLMTPGGKLTVDLDACSICKPDGYGQAEGTVICYYCVTLIPLETIGKPGGCNPVPVPFTEKDDGVIIDGMTLLNIWGTTVQATARVKEGSK